MRQGRISIRAASLGSALLAVALSNASLSHAQGTGISGPDWAKTLDAARKEGSVTVAGPPGSLYRNGITSGWSQDFPDIKLDYNAGRGTQVVAKIVRERAASLYKWDIIVASINPTLASFLPINALAPLRDAILDPTTTDDKNWLNGFDAGYIDSEKKYFYSPTLSRGYLGFVNRDCVSKEQLSKAEDLKSPALKGKISWFDPFDPGTGAQSTALLQVVYGDDWLKDMLKNHGVTFSRDYKQMTDWLVSCAKPVSIGMNTDLLNQMQKVGIAQNVEELTGDGYTREWRKGGAGGGVSIGLFNNAPHPNAAKVYLNWYLSRLQQQRFAELTQINSRRTDVTPVEPEHLPEPGKKYFNSDEEHNLYVQALQAKIRTWDIAER
jgi:iron(III) transport system substrate-binding protein